tara:strand:- start:461 stop:673 length:213 start_codon:yes stop_codon:yes gene_type:complete
MVKPIDITGTVIVPKPQPYQDKLKSFFIGRAPIDGEAEDTIEVEAQPRDRIKQPHLDNSAIKDTEWKDLY